MSQNGEENSVLSIDAINKKLDELEEGLRLPKIYYQGAEKYLEYSPAQVKAMNQEDCYEAALALSSYSDYVQRRLNKANAEALWAEKMLNKRLDKNSRLMLPDKQASASNGDELSNKLYKLMAWNKMIAERLAFRPQHIENIAQRYRDLGYARRSN